MRVYVRTSLAGAPESTGPGAAGFRLVGEHDSNGLSVEGATSTGKVGVVNKSVGGDSIRDIKGAGLLC